MSLIALDNCDYNIRDYDCGDDSYVYEENGDYTDEINKIYGRK